MTTKTYMLRPDCITWRAGMYQKLFLNLLDSNELCVSFFLFIDKLKQKIGLKSAEIGKIVEDA